MCCSTLLQRPGLAVAGCCVYLVAHRHGWPITLNKISNLNGLEGIAELAQYKTKIETTLHLNISSPDDRNTLMMSHHKSQALHHCPLTIMMMQLCIWDLCHLKLLKSKKKFQQ